METARCLEEGVLETPQDADLGAVYGWGFPAWTGGTISYIDTIGVEEFVREADQLAQRYGPRFLPSAWLRDKAAKKESFYEAQSELAAPRSEEHTSELQSIMRISYAVFCLKTKNNQLV